MSRCYFLSGRADAASLCVAVECKTPLRAGDDWPPNGAQSARRPDDEVAPAADDRKAETRRE